MRRVSTWVLILCCLAALTAACYGRALFRGEQFAYRDAGHFYYPLYERVQREWQAGRWPLWEPEENGGMPLMGNPTAAVLYPGKLLFAVVDYPLGARLYVVGHTLLAFVAMFALLRSWGTSATGSGLAAIAYAFGGPVLFQYCNIIYLVGASWAPLGIRAADRWLRLGRRWALLELAAVLAMETLGGDPEVAYLTGVCAAGYAAALAWGRGGAGEGARRFPVRVVVPGLLLIVAVWVAATLALAPLVPGLRPPQESGQPPMPLPWMPWVAAVVAVAWATAGLLLVARWRERRKGGARPVFVPMMAGLAGSAVLAGALASAQLLPVLEFTGQSGRAAGEGPHDIYPFSLEPLRVVEMLWPNLFGTPFHGNRSWQFALPPRDKNAKVWIPTLYLGGATAVLALVALTTRAAGRAPWRAWMTAVAAVSLLGSFGEFTGPLWWARLNRDLVKSIGPHDARDVAAIRFDRHLRDGDGGVYWTLATALPGFRQFRFPSKLLTFTALALAALAGQGWDALASGSAPARRMTVVWASVLLLLSLGAIAAATAGREGFLAWLGRKPAATPFGPLDAAGAFAEMTRGLAQGAAVFAVVLGVALWGHRRAGLAAATVLALASTDLAAANARYVLTVPQHVFEATPGVLAVLQAAERGRPADGPYRVHRMPYWDLVSWPETASPDRVRDFVRWERDTIQPKYAINLGVQYTMTLGVAELYDYEWFFGGFYRRVYGEVARSLGIPDGSEVVAYSRRSFDLWNTRYFVLPYHPGTWKDEQRGFASLLENTERVYPAPNAFAGADRLKKETEWVRTHDVQVRRNLSTYPRAWVVHDARFMKPIRGLTRGDRNVPMQEILFSNDSIWNDPSRTVYDARRIVWAEDDDRPALVPFVGGFSPGAGESVSVTRYESDRVELSATLERPGVVVLADVYYPGWHLTIDGKPAPVYRANRLMRGAAVAAGRHTLVYTYRPRSFRIGLILSGVGLAAFALLGLGFVRRPISATVAGDAGSPGRDLPVLNQEGDDEHDPGSP